MRNFCCSRRWGGVVMSNIPMLMDTGGNAGSQSSTLIIRAMALGDMTARDDVLALGKELLTSLLCGVGLGAVNFARMLLISRDTAWRRASSRWRCA